MHEKQFSAAAELSPSAAIGLLRRQRALYERLQALAERQHALVTEDDPRPLLKILAQRQQLTDELAQLNGRMAPLRQDWSSVRAGWPAAQRAEADELVADVAARLKQLLSGDEDDARRLRLRQQQVQADLTATRGQAQALAAYRHAAAAGSEGSHYEETHELS